jgi:hypothetical protein
MSLLERANPERGELAPSHGKSAAPAELGMYQSEGIDLIVNLRSTKSLGIDMPQGMIDRANALIK